jgi:hypothetical protein
MFTAPLIFTKRVKAELCSSFYLMSSDVTGVMLY